jgi:hypothetical protein
MSINKFGRSESTAAIYGITPRFFTVGDLGSTGNSEDVNPITALNGVTVATTSGAQTTNCRGVELHVSMGTAGATCTIVVYRVDPGPVDTEVFRKTLVGSGVVFAGGNEGVNLDGLTCKVRAESITAGTVTVKIKRSY